MPVIRTGLAKGMKRNLKETSNQWTGYERQLASAWDASDSLAVAPMWWVSRDMTKLAVDTATTGQFPHAKTPSPTGFIVFDGGIPLDAGSGEEIPAVDALLWVSRGSSIDENGDERQRIDTILLTRDPETVRKGNTPDIPLAHLQLPQTSLALPTRFGDILSAVWALSSAPRVAQVREPIPSSMDRMPRPAYLPANRVRMIVLRENLTRPGSAEKTNSNVEWTHRWIVRGFYRNQPYGENHSRRRKQWIPPYVKGPAGLPLIDKPTVKIWRR
jgi:hypothetical protein